MPCHFSNEKGENFDKKIVRNEKGGVQVGRRRAERRCSLKTSAKLFGNGKHLSQQQREKVNG